MTEPSLIARQRTLLHDLARLMAEKDAGPQLDQAFQERRQAVEENFQQARQAVVDRQAAEQQAADKQFAEARARITAEYDAEHQAIQEAILAARRKIGGTYRADRQAARAEFQEARWTINAVLEADRNRAGAEWKQAQERVADQRRKMQAVQLEADRLAIAWGADEDDRAPRGPANAPATVAECLTAAESRLRWLKVKVFPGFFWWRGLLWAGAAVWLLLVSSLYFLTEQLYWPIVAAAGAIAIVVAGSIFLKHRTRYKIYQARRPLAWLLTHAGSLCARFLARAKKEHKLARSISKKKYRRDLKAAQERYSALRQLLKKRRDEDWHRTEEQLRQRWARAQQRRDQDLRSAEEHFQQAQQQLQERYETGWQEVHDAYHQQLEEHKKGYAASWQDLAGRWREGMGQVSGALTDIHREANRLFPPWNDPSWQNWSPGQDFPPALRFGAYTVDLKQFGGLPADDRLRTTCPPSFELPACLAFPRRCSLLLEAEGDGRALAVDALQALMLRFLTTLPPGKVRFTIIDPVGLGQNFAAFMHLADYDEALVASRIWTEQAHIEQRLADLTGHMENVIQKYLRNQFATIEEYNAHAGEVAEPFRVLVVANFPVNFSAEAARRLVSVAASGARCGVYTLISVDTRQPMPQGFNLSDLEGPHVLLRWQGGHFAWQDADFGPYPLRLDAPPPADFCTRLMHRVGEQARDANRVEVPFEFIAPPPEQWWHTDSRQGIHVPLGRAGATKRQYLNLGQGTAHHVLIAGKTGSGKSTLLHALITSLALHYSPEEVELYLVDFKKGVEFKPYAAQELPHARVVAIESEREFGLSVLQRLDAELKQRGDRFRAAGAQNLAAYRDSNGKKATPRILLVVDEFQEFFIEDDRIAQEAAQLLDRLVRQGRAFGLHVLLGSQTLGGAYSLARSTIDQMAVRIALQCSEADGHIILSDDNSAARLLTRPGEAIYNDANGLVEGNNPFQVVWLSDEDREGYLQKIHELDRGHPLRPQIVFEGNAPADVRRNHLLDEALRSPAWPAGRKPASAWLGEAIAIKDPTAAVFRAQSASNLLLVGQHDEMSLGIMTTALVSLAAQHAPGETEGRPAARFYLLDGSPDDSPHASLLAQVAAALPHPSRSGGWRDLPALMNELAEEVDRRQKANEADAPAVYLFLYGLQRFRDLRKTDDDFSFSRRAEEKSNPGKQLATILREGPALGVHTLVWCDSLNNLNRCFDRQGMREFEMRVLFQMSATDSSVLIDTPLAGKLGLHRALFQSEDQGRLEKFRPYGLPAAEWLEEVRRLLGGMREAEALEAGRA